MLNKIILILIIITIGYAVSAIYIPMSEPVGESMGKTASQPDNALSVTSDMSNKRTVTKKDAFIEAALPLSSEVLGSDDSSVVAGDSLIVAPKLEMLEDETAIMEADLMMDYQPADQAARGRLLEELKVAKSYVSAKDREPQDFAVIDDGQLTVPATDEMQTEELLLSAKMTD